METDQSSPDKKKKKQKQSKKKRPVAVAAEVREEEEGGGGEGEGGKGGGDLDDLEFWLSKDDAPVKKKKKVCIICSVFVQFSKRDSMSRTS